MGFSRKEYYSGLPFPSPGDLPNLGTESTSLVLAGGFLTIEPPEKSDLLTKVHVQKSLGTQLLQVRLRETAR